MRVKSFLNAATLKNNKNMEIIAVNEIEKENIPRILSNINYYINSNKERGNLERVEVLEEYKKEVESIEI